MDALGSRVGLWLMSGLGVFVGQGQRLCFWELTHIPLMRRGVQTAGLLPVPLLWCGCLVQAEPQVAIKQKEDF